MNDLHILRLEPYDDATSTRDRLTFVEARRVLLVFPSNAPILRRKLDLLLVQRQATRLALRIALLTADPVVVDHARDLNISVFSSVDAARRAPWKKSRDKVFTFRRDPAARAEIAARLAAPSALRSAMNQRWWRISRWIIFAGLLLTLAAGLFLGGPSATVILTPANDQVGPLYVTITADPAVTDIDIESGLIPATIVTREATSHVTVQSSGRETAGASIAQGLVTFTNLSNEPLIIPVGTIIATSDTFPIRFETQIETTLPAAQTVQVPVQALAEHAGALGNVNANEINRVESDFSDQVTVTNPNATYGGAAQERAIVTAEDHERLLILGRQQVLQRARNDLLHQLSGGQFLVPGSVEIIQERPEWSTYSAIVGDSAESVSLDLRAQVQAVIVDGQQAERVAFSGLAPQIPPGREVSLDALTFTRGEIQQIEPNGRVTFLMIVQGNITVSLDLNAVRRRITGVSAGEAQRRLESELLLDPAHPPQITTWPGWYHRLPVMPVRITIEIHTP